MMLESCSETFQNTSDVFHHQECMNSETNNGNVNIESSVANCKNSNLSGSKIFPHPTSYPTVYIDEEKKIDGGIHKLNLNNIGEYSMEMLSQLTTSAATIFKNHHFDNAKNGAIKKRKSQKFKPSSVWNHFSRLSDGNVHCTHCGKILKRKDSSTKTMWGHLRAIHFKGEDWAILQQSLRDRNRSEMNGTEMQCVDELESCGIITTQNWLEQRVGILCDKTKEAQSVTEMIEQSSSNDSAATNSSLPWTTSTQSHIRHNHSLATTSNDCTGTNLRNIDHNDCTYNNGDALNGTISTFTQLNRSTDEKSLNFLSSIPHTSEVINITAGYNDNPRCVTTLNGKLEQNGNSGYGNVDMSVPTLNVSNCLLSSPVQNFLNPADQPVPSVSSPLLQLLESFSIFDPDSMAVFMRTATDLDCTLSFRCRNNQPQLSFESNCTTVNKLKGMELCMTEINDEVNVVVRSGGVELDRESWKKTDKAQFIWAIRGKCQKVLSPNESCNGAGFMNGIGRK